MKTRLYNIPIGLLLLLAMMSCNGIPDQNRIGSDPDTPSKDNSTNPVDAGDEKWVILRKVPAGNEEIASLLFESDGFWTPSVDDIQLIEGKIVDYLTQNANKFFWQPPVWERLDEYNRQYIGLERGAKKIIFGNFFCESGKQDWKKDLIFAIDGGECYFQVEFDLESGLFSSLRINGES